MEKNKMINNDLKLVETRMIPPDQHYAYKINDPGTLMSFAKDHISERSSELMSIIYINSHGKVIDFDLCRADTFERNFKYVLSQAVVKNAFAISLVSNTYIDKAYDMTMMFNDACQLLGIRLFDHICGHESFFERYGIKKNAVYHDQISIEGGAVVNDSPLAYLSTASVIDIEDNAVDSVCDELSGSDREKLCIINYDKNKEPINYSVVSIGTYTEAHAVPAIILKSSLLSGASYFTIIHNHPSGDPKPSMTDHSLFQMLYDSGHLLGMEMDDAVIVGGLTGDIYSFRDSGEMDQMISEKQHLVSYRKGGGR